MKSRSTNRPVPPTLFGVVRGKLAVVLAVGVMGVIGLHTYLHYHVHVSGTGGRPSAAAASSANTEVADSSRSSGGNDARLVVAQAHNRPRVYCMVPFVWPHVHSMKGGAKHARGIQDALHKNAVKKGSYGPERHAEIMATWGKKCDMIEFFIDRPPGTPLIPNLPANVISINMSRFLDASLDHGQDQKSSSVPLKERYGKHIWEKMWRSWIWVRQNRARDYDWFAKVDDDCFLFVENIRWFVMARNWSPLDTHYFGHKLYHRASHGVPYTLIAGATVLWSRAALEVAASAYESMPKFEHHGPERGRCEDRPHASEEVSTARCLIESGVIAEPARDELEREMILLFHASALMFAMKRPPAGHRDEGWYWKQKPKSVTELHTCCSTRPISFHAMKGNTNLHSLNKFFYNPDTPVQEINRWMNKDNNPIFNQWLFETRGNLTELHQLGGYERDNALPAVAHKRAGPPPPNPRAADTPSQSSTGLRYITWDRNSGNLNNQLISAAAAFDTALELNRTVLLRVEATLMGDGLETAPRPWDKVLFGYEEGLWDLAALRKVYRFELESDVIRQYGSLKAHPVLGRYDPKCTVLPNEKNPIAAVGVYRKLDAACPVIHLGGSGGQLRFQEQSNVNGFFRVFRPASYLVEAADTWLKSVDWGTPSGRPHLTVHSRSFWEGRRCSDAYQFCSGKVTRELKKRLVTPPSTTIHSDVAGVMCFANPSAINLVLDRSELAAHTIVNCSDTTAGPCRPWFLASDSQTAGMIEGQAKAYGAHQFSTDAVKLSRTEYRKDKIHKRPWKWIIHGLESSYLDLYLLSQGEVFLGNVFSTFSSSVCKMRAINAPSNVCKLLTQSKPDSFLESLKTQGLPTGWHLPWKGSTPEADAVRAQADTKRPYIKCE